MGFQSNDPCTDFRAMGLLGLHCLLYLASHYPERARSIIRDGAPKRDYPYGSVGINVVATLVEMLGLGRNGAGGLSELCLFVCAVACGGVVGLGLGLVVVVVILVLGERSVQWRVTEILRRGAGLIGGGAGEGDDEVSEQELQAVQEWRSAGAELGKVWVLSWGVCGSELGSLRGRVGECVVLSGGVWRDRGRSCLTSSVASPPTRPLQ
eukprot:3688133-Rhodomonas_salina.1